MKIYLVGGAVRDELLGLPVHERDWVVVGATPEEMKKQGFRQVGKDFPVFLHPKTHEEYALARTERKVSPGYTGFVFHASPHVTVEEDLMRRDLTINAIAKDESGQLIDPFHGQADLQNKILRHVSHAFAEDPVRILRAARFAARFSEFKVADETNRLMHQMVLQREVDELVAERVWQEFQRALSEAAPQRFFEVLEKCQALAAIFPEMCNNAAAIHALSRAVKLTSESMIRFAAMLHNFSDLKLFCMEWRVPKEWFELAELTQNFLADFQQANPDNPSLLLTILQKTDAFRRPERFAKWLIASQACLQEHAEKTIVLFCESLMLTQNVNLSRQEYQELTGPDIQKTLYAKRLEALQQYLQDKY